jgi:hypothetical protein
LNWGQAKNLLIVAFVILDLILVSLYLDIRRYAPGHSAAGQAEPELVAHLAENNITLAAELPWEVPSLPLLRVGIEKQNPYPIALSFFGTLTEVNVIRPEDPLLELVFTRDQEELLFYTSGVNVYTHRGLDRSPSDQTAVQAEKQAQNFLATHGGSEGLTLIRTVPYRRQGTYLVEFGQSYKGFPLVGASGAVLVVTPEGVENYWRRFLNVLGESGEPRAVITAAEALSALALQRPRPEAIPLTVREVVLGYLNRVYNADEWEAAPVWRIWTGGDSYFYINAFTGELETS